MKKLTNDDEGAGIKCLCVRVGCIEENVAGCPLHDLDKIISDRQALTTQVTDLTNERAIHLADIERLGAKVREYERMMDAVDELVFDVDGVLLRISHGVDTSWSIYNRHGDKLNANGYATVVRAFAALQTERTKAEGV